MNKIHIAMLACALAACGGETPGPEAEIRAMIEAAEHAAQRGDFSAIADFIDPGYRDARGQDRDTLIRMLRLQGLRSTAPEILTSIEAIEIHADSAADVELTMLMAAAGEGRFSLDAGRYQLDLELIRSDTGDWTVIAARWERAGEKTR